MSQSFRRQAEKQDLPLMNYLLARIKYIDIEIVAERTITPIGHAESFRRKNKVYREFS